ncbi:MAG: NADH-quinone oxidoreductase subunit A [Pirellulales bacterium]|nr:NADH-quinone oxidoreductase subunit A [Pirellulales bacterium]
MTDPALSDAVPIFLFVACAIALAVVLLVIAQLFNPARPGRVKRMPYESGMDPFHDARRRFDVRFYLLAIAFLVFDVELLFLYPWAVASHPAAVPRAATVAPTDITPPQTAPAVGIDAAVASGLVENRTLVFAGAMLFILLLVLGFVYDWRKGVFQWR